MANIKFEYLYRDACNNKQYGEVVFTNNDETRLADIEAQIRATLHDGEWFKAEMVNLETCFFDRHDMDDDHPWHELFAVSETDLTPSDPAFMDGPHRDIAQFIRTMENGKLRKWDPECLLCHICDQPFIEDEWEKRHDLHEPDCPRVRTKGKQTFGEIFCACNLVTHARCCPECTKAEFEPVEVKKKAVVAA